MRIKDDMLSFNPYIPDGWEKYSFKIFFRTHIIQQSRNSLKEYLKQALKNINKKILSKFTLTGGNIALDGSGFTNDYTDKYFAKIRRKRTKKL